MSTLAMPAKSGAVSIQSQPHTPETQNDIEVSIVMPCLNEILTLKTCILSAQALVAKLDAPAEIIVADNGSTDGSQELAREMGARLIEVPRRGYGAALIDGCKAARGKYIIMADSDASYDFLEGEEMVKQMRAGYELVMGSRFKGQIQPGAMPWKNRYIGNPLLTGILNLFFQSGLSDAHSGIRGFTREAFDKLDLRCPGMEFASEMVVKAALIDLKRTEVPVTLHKDGRDRPPHLNPWRDGWRHLRFLLLYAPRWVYMIPGLIMLMGGLLVSILINLLPTPVRILGIPFGDHWIIPGTMFAALGLQSLFLGVFMHAYSAKSGMYPRERWIHFVARQFTLERGLLIGMALVAVGVLILGGIFAQWVASSFGALAQLRLGVFGMMWIMLGAQFLLNSFLLSLMMSEVRESEFERAPVAEVEVPAKTT